MFCSFLYRCHRADLYRDCTQYRPWEARGTSGHFGSHERVILIRGRENISVLGCTQNRLRDRAGLTKIVVRKTALSFFGSGV